MPNNTRLSDSNANFIIVFNALFCTRWMVYNYLQSEQSFWNLKKSQNWLEFSDIFISLGHANNSTTDVQKLHYYFSAENKSLCHCQRQSLKIETDKVCNNYSIMC